MATKNGLSYPKKRNSKESKHVLVIHGGAGTILREKSPPEQQARYHAGLRAALQAGNAILSTGGEAMDAVVAAVSVMEDNPLFNSGKGAVFNSAGFNELEVSLALSSPPASHPHIPPSRRTLALTLLTRTRNPSQLARALYLSPAATPHPFISGAPGRGPRRPSARRQLHRRGLGLPEDEREGDEEKLLDMMPKGTVGAVALDVRGCIALPGRIGDTPHNGAGFWAEEWTVQRPWYAPVGVSGTGDGDVRLIPRNLTTPLDKAARWVVEALDKEHGAGGVIALDNEGNVATPLNCPGMYRGLVREDGELKTAIFDDEILE
ncbi:asparaginase [Lactarius indigo]|nr:asparaginase [Lactarius indigo]